MKQTNVLDPIAGKRTAAFQKASVSSTKRYKERCGCQNAVKQGIGVHLRCPPGRSTATRDENFRPICLGGFSPVMVRSYQRCAPSKDRKCGTKR